MFLEPVWLGKQALLSDVRRTAFQPVRVDIEITASRRSRGQVPRPPLVAAILVAKRNPPGRHGFSAEPTSVGTMFPPDVPGKVRSELGLVHPGFGVSIARCQIV